MTDHHSLTNYFKQHTFNTKQARTVDILSGFDFEIKHLKGKGNHVVDALSRKANCLYEISFNEAQNTFREQIKEAEMQDPEYQTLWKKKNSEQ